MKKRLVAFLLVLIMVLGMLPVSAFAADDGVSPQALESNETQTIKYQILYVGDEFNTGYSYGVSVNKTYTCQYSTGHSGFNHSILISEFRNVGVPALKGQLDSGYEFVGWAKEAKENPTIYDFNVAGTTATQTTYTIYLVAKKAVPPTVTYTLTYYPNTTDLVTNMPSPNPVTQKSSTSPVTFTVSSAIPAREGYNFLGWNGKPDATTPTVQPGNWVTTPATATRLYAVWQSNTPPTDKPAKPTENDVTGVVVDIVCVTTTGTHDTVQYPLGHPTDAQHTIGEVVSDGAGGYICPVTVRTAWFVQQASNLVWKVQHTPTAQTITFNLTYDKNSKTWVKPAANPRIEATHEVTPPTKPTALDGSFAIVCKNNKATHPYKADYIATPSQYTISDVQKDEQGYYVTATVTVAPNLVAYNTATRVEHRLVDEQDATLTITFRYDTEVTGDENRKWQQQGELPVVEVICKPKAPTADDLKKLEMAVQVKCVVDASQQHTEAYSLLGEYDEDYFVGEPRKDGDDWLCDISYVPDLYVAEFNTTFQNLKHVQNDEQIVPVTLIWAGDSWQLKTQGRVHVTEVYTVTYTDGVENEEVFADQVYSDLRKDSATPAFNGTPTRTGYTFAGWEPEVAETVTETVTYAAKWTPVEPTHDDIFKALNGLVTVTCINRFWKDGNKNMDCGQGQYAAKAGIAGQEYTLEKGENAGTWVVTFPVTNFVKSFKQDPAHNLYTKDTLRWYIRWENNAWTSAPVEPGVDDLVKLTHAPTDWREVAKIATGGKSDCIHVSCVNGETGVCDYGITVPFVYSATDVVSVEPEDGVPGSYIATFKVDRYIDTCAKACNDKNFKDAPHTQAADAGNGSVETVRDARGR